MASPDLSVKAFGFCLNPSGATIDTLARADGHLCLRRWMRRMARRTAMPIKLRTARWSRVSTAPAKSPAWPGSQSARCAVTRSEGFFRRAPA